MFLALVASLGPGTQQAPSKCLQMNKGGMSADIETRRELPTPWVPQFTEGQTDLRARMRIQFPWIPRTLALRSFCPIPLLCGPRQGSAPLWALAFPSASPELVRVGSEGRLVLFAGFRKSLGPQQQRCPTPTLPSIGRRGVGVEGETLHS